MPVIEQELGEVEEDIELNTPYDKRPFQVGVLQKEYFIQATKKGGPQYVRVYDERFLKYLAALVQEYVGHEFDVPVIVTGEPRTGKTSVTINLGKEVDRSFGLPNITFRLDDMAKCIKNNPKVNVKMGRFPQAQLDEAVWDLFPQQWMDNAQIEFVKTLQVIGKLCNTYYFVAPNREDINARIRDHRARFWIYTKHWNLRRGVAELWQSEPDRWGARWWQPQCVFMFDAVEKHLWEGYERNKIAFIEGILSDPGEGKQKSNSIRRVQEQRDNAIRALSKMDSMTQERIEEITGLHQSRISKILKSSSPITA